MSWRCSQTDFRLSVLIRVMTVGPGRCPNLERGMVEGGGGVQVRRVIMALGRWVWEVAA